MRVWQLAGGVGEHEPRWSSAMMQPELPVKYGVHPFESVAYELPEPSGVQTPSHVTAPLTSS